VGLFSLYIVDVCRPPIFKKVDLLTALPLAP